MDITNIQEDYIRALYLLEQELKKPIKLANLVAKMNLSKSTVTQRLQSLTQKGWVKHEKYGPVKLTTTGKKIAENLTYKHRIIEMFLNKTLKLTAQEIHEEAHKLEHALSNKVIAKIAEFLGNPTHCPHGKEIPPFHKNLSK